MSQYNYFTDSGLTALLNSLKTTKGKAEGNTSAISELESDFQEMTQQVAGVVGDVASCLQELDTVKANATEVEEALETKQDKLTGSEYVSIGDRTALTSGQDLNDVKTPGCYKAATIILVNSLVNLPSEFADSNFILDVYKNNDTGYITQRLTEMTTELRATRHYNSSWGPWSLSYSDAHKPTLSELGAAASGHIHTPEEIGAAIGSYELVSGTDFNTVTVSGMYRFGSDMVNGPTGVSYSQLLVISGGGDTITQIVGQYSDGAIFTRSGNPLSSGGTWSNWLKLSVDGHSHAASTITAGTLAGQVLANATAVATLGTAQMRNIYAGTGALTANSSGLTTGNIYLQYE